MGNEAPKMYERVHKDYCKRVLNVSKYASDQAWLGRTSIENQILYMIVKYWLRLEQGSENEIVNNASRVAKAENHEWVESIKYFLFRNGFVYAWDNPHWVHPKLFA